LNQALHDQIARNFEEDVGDKENGGRNIVLQSDELKILGKPGNLGVPCRKEKREWVISPIVMKRKLRLYRCWFGLRKPASKAR
jgi:hypothetical protein